MQILFAIGQKSTYANIFFLYIFVLIQPTATQCLLAFPIRRLRLTFLQQQTLKTQITPEWITT